MPWHILAASKIKLQINGLSSILLKETKAQLQTKLELLEKIDQNKATEFCNEAPTEITKFLKLYGYFNSKVMQCQPKLRGNKWEFFLVIQRRSPLIIQSITLKIDGEGKNDPALTLPLARLPIRVGDVFEVAKYNSTKQLLFNVANNCGYPQTALTYKEIKVDLEKNSAAITLHLDTKQRCYFGTTIFNTSFFDKSFLTKFLKYKPGDRYSSNMLRSLENSLTNSAFFQQVEIKQNLDKKLRDIPIEIVVTPKKSQQYVWGLGYGTDTGIRGFLEAKANYLTNTCHSLRSHIQVSEIQNNMTLHYLIPGNYPPTDLYDLGLTGESLRLKQGDSTVGILGLSYTTSLKDWQQTLKISLQYERYNLWGQPYKTSKLALSSLHWSRSKKDDLIKPNRGYNINASVIGATKYTLSTSSFLQTQLRAKFMQPLSQKTQLIFNSAIGFTAIDDISQLPLSLQFYAGGTQSIRGFSYNSIGPGTNLILGSATLRQQISKKFYLETFIDTGNVSNNLLGRLARGIGCGIVWRTIIGSVELTYAKAISRPGSPGMIHLSIGPEL